MSNLKRTRSQMDDSDDEPTMGKQILPVARLPDNFDGEPMDGMQYLFTVRRDARKLPNFTRVENPFSIECAKMETPDAPATDRARVVLPSEEWRTVFLTRFKNFRKNSAQATIGVALPPSSRRSKIMPEKKERDNWWAFINGRPECEWNPPKKHRKPWQETNSHAESMHSWENGTSDLSQYEVSYTNDAPESEALVVNEYGEIEEDMNDIDMEIEAEEISAVDSLPTPFATPQPESRYKSSNFAPELQNVQTQRKLGGKLQQPTPTLLKGMDSRYCTHLLMYFTYWITQNLVQLESSQPLPSAYTQLSQTHACWMFALLARVDEQISSDEMSNLRSLARACLTFIRDLNKNLSLDDASKGNLGSSVLSNWVGDAADAPLDERACWIIVTMISDFWGQKDLWMDAESILNGP